MSLSPFPKWSPEVIRTVAQICHEANRDYCESMLDHSQARWEEAEDWQKQSAFNGVMFAVTNNFPSPRVMHENWCSEKFADGWQHGATKDPAKKRHPCLIRYDELPEAQKAKDLIFRAICVGISAALYRPEVPEAEGLGDDRVAELLAQETAKTDAKMAAKRESA